MASWPSVAKRIVRELERQGGTARRTGTSGWMVKHPTTGQSVVLHSSPGRAAQSRHNIEQGCAAAGFKLPPGFKL